jgi:hypothetical protein
VPIARHRDQGHWHLIRHGPTHIVQHLRNEHHGHNRLVVDRQLRNIRRLTLVGLGLGFLVLIAIVLAALSYSPLNDARNDLNRAKDIISADLTNKALLSTAAGRAQLQSDIGTVSADAAQANRTLQSSEAIKVLGLLPVLKTQRDGILTLSTDVEAAAAAGNQMLLALNTLVATSHGTTVNLPNLANLEFYVIESHKILTSLNRPTSGLLGPIATARTAFNREDTKLVRLLSLTTQTVSFARNFLGANGPQTYLIGGENNAEMRDGGAVESLAVLTAADGTFSIGQDSSYGNYILTHPAAVTLPAGTQQVFGPDLPTENWPSVDSMADFSLTGESMQAMWAQATGQQVNGVMTIDIPGVASILKLTGPVLVAGINEPVTAANVGDLLLNKEYIGDAVNDPQNSRRDKIAAVVRAAVNQMKFEHVDLDAFASALAKDVQGRHLMVWSNVASYEHTLSTLDAAGTLTTGDPARTFHVSVENYSSSKLDYFVSVGLSMKVKVDPSGDAIVDTTVNVANHALTGQPPSYQYGPDGANATVPGQYAARVFFWGPRGSELPSAIPESGLQVALGRFSLLPQQKGTTTFATVIHHAVVNGHLQLHIVPQARLVPDALTVQIQAAGWNLTGPSQITTNLGDTVNLQWGLSR